jgi:hypothetical protein
MKTVLKEEGSPVHLFETYLAMIKNSVGSRQYQCLFVHEEIPRDVIENGRFACAYFASAICSLNTLIAGGIHTTVVETIADLILSGAYQIQEPVPGAIIIWGPKLASDSKLHKHIGFYIGDDLAVSTDGITGIPTTHHFTYGYTDDGPVRPIETIFFHEKLRY